MAPTSQFSATSSAHLIDPSSPFFSSIFTPFEFANPCHNNRRSIAAQASIQVLRAFVKLRELLGTHRKLAVKLIELESRIQGHDEDITAFFEAIRQLMDPPEKPSRRIGFHP